MRVLYIVLVIMLTFSPFLSFSATTAQAMTEGKGYICRLSTKTQYSSDSDVIVQVVAFYAVSGRYVPRPVNIHITLMIAGTDEIVKERNLTINDNQKHDVNLGRLEQNTYTIRAAFPDTIKEDNFVVLHPPVPYSISMSPEKISFHSLGGKNDTFTITIKALYGPENEISATRSNVTNLTYRVQGKPQIVSVWVTDRWGNVNGLNDGRAYVITLTKPTEYYFYRPFVAFGIIAIGISMIVYLKKREVSI